MKDYCVKTDNGIAYIINKSAGLIIKAEKNRTLIKNDCGAVMEATLYIEATTFIPHCNYVFEAVDKYHKPCKRPIDAEVFKSAVKYFFNCYLKTALYVKKIPLFSSLYKGDVLVIMSDNANDFYLNMPASHNVG